MRFRAGLAALTGALALTSACAYTTRDLAPELPVNAQSSKMFAADGSLLTVLHAEENREEIALTDIPQSLQDAVVAIEDERFWEHKGVDLRAVLRAARTNASEGTVAQGGSTITQQYVKTALLEPDQTLSRKIQEAALAFQLERKYSKERILELYLNTIYFGNGAYGVQAAAQEYFGKPVGQLGLAECALLAGLIRAPSATDPYDAPDAATARRDVVLGKMHELHLIDDAALAAAKAEPLELAPPTSPDERYPAAHFVEEVKQWILHDPQFGATPAERRNLLFGGGLRIYTTVDLALQAEAEQAIARVLSVPGADPAAALVSIDPRTGYVRALVGGADFFGQGEQAKYDLAVGKGRPTGSAFKPIVLAAALEEGIPLSTELDAPPAIDIPITGDKPWHVDNYGEGGPGVPVDLVEATVRSYNTVYAQLIMKVGPTDAISTAAKMGVQTPLEAVPAAVLGANDVRPIDMASVYATLANRGVHVPPALVTRITRADGTVLYAHQHTQTKALDPMVADEVTSVLEQVIARGTGVHAAIGRPAAGKTGTGQDWKDAWFCGYTPDLATAVWVGFADPPVPMVPPTTRVRVTGGSWPADIWQLYMSAALAETPASAFVPPPAPNATTTTAPAGETASPGPGMQVVRGVIGMPVGPAVDLLTRLGFVVYTASVADDQYPPGYVRAQSPLPGSLVKGGSEVTLEVANGQSPTLIVPDVLGMTAEEATAALRGEALQVQVVEEQEPPSAGASERSGRVWKQSPAGQSWAGRGSVVTIWVNPPAGP